MFGMFVSAEPHGRVTLAPGNLISAALIFCKSNLNQACSAEMPYNSHSITLPSDLFSLALHPSKPLLAAGLSSGHLHTYTWPHSGDSNDNDDDDDDHDDDNAQGDAKSEENGGFKISWKTRRHKGSCRCIAFSGDGDGGFILLPQLRDQGR